MVKRTKGSMAPMSKQPTVEEVKKNLRRVIEETHRRHKGKKDHYRINVMPIGALADIPREELEEMGCTVRSMPNFKKGRK
jgi:hypothetical protein